MSRDKNLIFKNIKYFVPLLLKSNPYVIMSTIISSLLSSLSSLMWIYFPKMILDLLFIKNSIDIHKVIVTVFIFVIIKFFINILLKINDNISEYCITKADSYIDKQFNDKISKLDYYRIEDPTFIDKIDNAKKGLSTYTNGIYSILNYFNYILTSIITIIGVAAIVISCRNWIVIVLSLISVIVTSIANFKYTNIQHSFNTLYVRAFRKQWYYNESIMSLNNQKDLRYYEAKEFIKGKGDKLNKEINFEREKITRKLNIISIFEKVFNYICNNFFIIIILGYSVYTKNISLSLFSMLLSSIETFNHSLSNLVYCAKSYVTDCKYQNDFIDIMNTVQTKKDGIRKLKEIVSVEFKNVSFKYPRTEKYILKNINFKITDKQKISLIGLNGSGKTTLIKLICRFYEIEEGEILINGQNIIEYDYEDYIKKIGVVFQDFKILSFNIKNNVSILDDNKVKLYNCLKRAQVLNYIKKLPNKEYTYINKWFDKQGIEFSGGELQKLAFARALYKNSDLVVLDEPTSALDPIVESEIYEHFNDVVGTKLTLFISHRLSSCIFSDKILVLDGSSIVEQGNHNELMRDTNGLYYKMFSAQAKYYKF
ncbi:MAG: ATP-binding cassette domain-containing protein [Bacilli bacterium]|nr:ATP-binding cassette domain-containing protein [Bacilli bacterium]MDD3098978.1 ATP-binding cassette domain-containing protein [Bacilli bacterium]